MAGEVGAHGAKDRRADAKKFAVGVERQAAVDHRIARVVVGQYVLVARRAPFDRAFQHARRMEDSNVFGVGLFAHAKPAADVVADHVHLFVRDFQDMVAEDADHVADALAGGDKFVSVALRVVVADAGARLHRIGDDARIEKLQSRDMGRGRECPVDLRRVAALPCEGNVAGRLVPQQRGSGLHREFGIRNRGQGFDLDFDLGNGVLGLREGFGDNKRNRFPDVAHAPLRQSGARRFDREKIEPRRVQIGNAAESRLLANPRRRRRQARRAPRRPC